jgi:hypothetical protein
VPSARAGGTFFVLRVAVVLELLCDEFFAFLPKRVSGFRIERVSTDALADAADRYLIGNRRAWLPAKEL